MPRARMAAIGLIGYRPFKKYTRGRGIPTPAEKDAAAFLQESNNLLIEAVITHLSEQYGPAGFYLVTMGSDVGFGKDVLRYCIANKLRLVKLEAILQAPSVDANGNEIYFGTVDDHNAIFMSRHAALMELCQQFFIKVSAFRSQLDDLIVRIKSTDAPYYIYGDDNVLLEYKGDPSG